MNFPTVRSPEATITLQVECVSCKHYFSVDVPSFELELPYNHVNQTRNRGRRLSQPVACPRCQADNRYWLRILHVPQHFTPLRQDLPMVNNFINSVLQWLNQFKITVATFVITGLMVFWELTRHMEKGADHFVTNVAFVVLTILTGTTIVFSITGHWKQAREFRLISRYRQTNQLMERIPPHFETGAKLFFVFVLFIPLAILVVLPGISSIVHTITSDPATPQEQSMAAQLRSLADTSKQLSEQLLQSEWDETTRAELDILVAAVISDTEELVLWFNQAESARPLNEEDAKAATSEQTSNDNQATDEDEKEVSNASRLLKWWKFLGLTGVVAFVLSYQAVNGYIRQVNPLLPPPIYVNVVNMTNVAIAEIQQTLRIPHDELQEIEWMDAHRNSQGGLVISGTRVLIRDSFQNPKLTRTYTVETDEWGRVQNISTKNGNGH